MTPLLPSGVVLLIEDDRDLREVMQEGLEIKGLQVATAGNGAEALRYLRGHPKPSLILLDLMMPVMDGATFRSAQLAEESFRDIPVIILSADRDLAKKAAAMQVRGYLDKPADLHKLVDLIHRCAQPGS